MLQKIDSWLVLSKRWYKSRGNAEASITWFLIPFFKLHTQLDQKADHLLFSPLKDG